LDVPEARCEQIRVVPGAVWSGVGGEVLRRAEFSWSFREIEL